MNHFCISVNQVWILKGNSNVNDVSATMVSRSSSAYHPLAQATLGETMTHGVPRRSSSALLRVQDVKNEEINEKNNHEAGFS